MSEDQRPILEYRTSEAPPPEGEGESVGGRLFLSVVAALLVVFILSAIVQTLMQYR